MAVGQLLGQLPQGSTSTVDLNRKKKKKRVSDKNREKGDGGVSFHAFFSYLDVLHVLKEVRLGIVVVGELD